MKQKNKLDMMNYIRDYCEHIIQEEKLTLKQITFVKGIIHKDLRMWGVCLSKKHGKILFSKELLNPIEFEILGNWELSVREIILHELAHLKFEGHGKKFHAYWKKLIKKYPIKDFYLPILKNYQKGK